MPLLWKDFTQSCQLLETEGMLATKLNYSNMRTAEVKVTLTHNRTRITYEEQRTKTCCLSGLIFGSKKRSVHKITDFMAVIYGATAATFLIHLADHKDGKVKKGSNGNGQTRNDEYK